MKVLIQRVKEASVEVDSKVIGSIEHGFLLYVCFEESDIPEKLELAVNKIKNLRIFPDDNDKMNFNILQAGGKVLSISQFTLSWDGKKGHRPSFDKSMPPNDAKIFYRNFNDALEQEGVTVEKGRFGADMKVSSINDGPVTFFLEY